MTENRVTIADVQNWYQRADGIVESSALRSLLGSLIDRNYKAVIELNSYLDSLIFTEAILEKTNRHISIVAGPGCGDFLKAIYSAFESAVQRLKEHQGCIRVLVLSEQIPAFLTRLDAIYSGTLEIVSARLRAHQEIEHFLVSDSKMGRKEEPHERFTPDTTVNAVRAEGFLNDPARAQLLEARFEAYWKVASTKLAEA